MSENREHGGSGLTHLCTPSRWHTIGRQQAWEGGRQGRKMEGRKGCSFLFILVQPVGDSESQSSIVLVSSTPVSPSGKSAFSQSPSLFYAFLSSLAPSTTISSSLCSVYFTCYFSLKCHFQRGRHLCFGLCCILST